jgi:cytochrome c biogenesis protein CcmG/thiol:disulfide interchange protein DsbE
VRARPILALAGVAAVAGVLVYAFATGFGRDPHQVPFMLKGKPAPAFTLTRLDTGEPVTLAQLRGRPVVLNFWASWCGPCKIEHPTLARAARRHQADAHFFGVVFEDTPEAAREFARPLDPSFPQLIDPQSRMAVDFGVTGVPETYFIDADGIIRDKFVGPLLDEHEISTRLQALAGPGPVSGVAR